MKELLLLLANYPYISSDKEALTRFLTGVRDWDTFVNLVNAHGIIALAAYNIKEARLVSLVPAKAMTMLENGLRQSIVRNAWLAERWKEVNEILCNAGIKHILLKGMALEHTIYGSRGLRQMTDNDILISGNESIRAWNLLRENGFEPMESKSEIHRRIMFKTGQHMPALFRDAYAVEIHTDKDLFNDEEIKDLFKITDEFTIGGLKAFKLKDEAHIGFLKNHFTRHTDAGECQMRSYNDIRLLDPGSGISFPESFVMVPDQTFRFRYRRNHYRTTIKAVKTGSRLSFIIGDIFPSLEWMRRRYSCGTFQALLKYPMRLGKLVWLI